MLVADGKGESVHRQRNSRRIDGPIYRGVPDGLRGFPQVARDGDEIAASDGANVLGNPLNALAWLANHLAGRGHELKAGQWITTGAATGPLPAPVGSTVTADFADLGTVEVRFQG